MLFPMLSLFATGPWNTTCLAHNWAPIPKPAGTGMHQPFANAASKEGENILAPATAGRGATNLPVF